MGTIRKRENKDGTESFLVQVRIKGSKPINQSFPTHSEADTFMRREESRILREQNQRIKGDPRQFHNDIFTDVIRMWIDKHPTEQKRIMQLQTVLRNFGDIRTGMIDEDYVQDYVNQMLKTVNNNKKLFAPGTISQHFAAMNLIYKWRAKQLRVPIGEIPFKTGLLPKDWNEGRDRRLLPFEELKLRARMRRAKHKHHWRLLLNLALESGARYQELFLAEWKHISLDTRSWHIPKENCKTRKARDIPMSKKMIRTFKVLAMLKDPNDSRIFHPFKTKDGTSGTFFYFLEECQIKDLHFHDLRHEAISRMILFKRNLSMYEVMRIVGHTSISMLNRYANLRSHELADRMD